MKAFLKKKYKKGLSEYRKYRLKTFDKSKKPLQIIIGSGNTYQRGWLSTDIEFLNLLQPSDWERYFSIDSIDAILAEHVWEHLTIDEGKAAARNCYKYLKSGGYIRIAVPDGLNPDKDYIEMVQPGGFGEGSDDHKVLYTYAALKHLFESVGFTVDLLEYHDEQGKFIFNEWDTSKGMIHRSLRFDKRNVGGKLKFNSIILDAKKKDQSSL